VQGEGDVGAGAGVEPGDYGAQGTALAEEAGDDVVAFAGQVADVAVAVVDADGVAVVGVGGFGAKGEFVAEFEGVEVGEIAVLGIAAEGGGLQAIGADGKGQGCGAGFPDRLRRKVGINDHGRWQVRRESNREGGSRAVPVESL
jgi:hypothetical protein